MKAYIAGKISGDSTYREKFKTAEQALSNQGFVVLNPADLPEGMNPADYMRICFAMMESADIVAFLPDYEQSRGAQLEWSWCQYAGKQTMYRESMSFYRDALKEQEPVTDRNRPLTLDELRRMDGEPVWLVNQNGGRWVIMSGAYLWDSRKNADYGKTWLAYRQKPEEGTV